LLGLGCPKQAFAKITTPPLKSYLDKSLTITADNGKEFAGHDSMTAQLDAAVVLHTPIIPGEAWTK
jgi:IS30 family transposase